MNLPGVVVHLPSPLQAAGSNLTDPTGLTVPVSALPQCPPDRLFLAAWGCRQQERQAHSCEFNFWSPPSNTCSPFLRPLCFYTPWCDHCSQALVACQGAGPIFFFSVASPEHSFSTIQSSLFFFFHFSSHTKRPNWADKPLQPLPHKSPQRPWPPCHCKPPELAAISTQHRAPRQPQSCLMCPPTPWQNLRGHSRVPHVDTRAVLRCCWGSHHFVWQRPAAHAMGRRCPRWVKTCHHGCFLKKDPCKNEWINK